MPFRKDDTKLPVLQREASTPAVLAVITIFLAVLLMWVRIIETWNRHMPSSRAAVDVQGHVQPRASAVIP